MAIIFDFDGVIVNSEILIAKINERKLNELPFDDIKNAEVRKLLGNLFGMHFQTVMQLLDAHNLSLPEHFTESWLKDMGRVMEEESQPLIRDLLEILHEKRVDRCIASNGKLSIIQTVLSNTKQAHLFDPERIFTASDVHHPKPAPDLFLYAANKIGYKPDECVVIEDSIVGLTAAIAAKIPAIAFAGACHTQKESHLSQVRSMGIPIARNSEELLEMLIKMKQVPQ